MTSRSRLASPGSTMRRRNLAPPVKFCRAVVLVVRPPRGGPWTLVDAAPVAPRMFPPGSAAGRTPHRSGHLPVVPRDRPVVRPHRRGRNGADPFGTVPPRAVAARGRGPGSQGQGVGRGRHGSREARTQPGWWASTRRTPAGSIIAAGRERRSRWSRSPAWTSSGPRPARQPVVSRTAAARPAGAPPGCAALAAHPPGTRTIPGGGAQGRQGRDPVADGDLRSQPQLVDRLRGHGQVRDRVGDRLAHRQRDAHAGHVGRGQGHQPG